MAQRINTIAIIGLGLIGSSIARAARLADPSLCLKGYDASAEVCDVARRLKLVDEVRQLPEEVVRDADLVILCVPVGIMEEIACSITASVSASAIITDVGSSKTWVGRMLRTSMPGARIVPAHPVAGSEQSGPLAGSPDLFRGRWCILTPETCTEASDTEAVSSFWQALGAKVAIMTAEQHDLVLAGISHVPHLLAFSAVAAVIELENEQGYPIFEFAAGGFRDFTRIAAANPQVWRDIFISNKAAILEVSSRFRTAAERLEGLLLAEDDHAILKELMAAQEARSGMFLGGGSDAQ